MDIIDVDDVLGDDSFIGDTERLDDEVEEILKQWKSSSTFPSSSSTPSGATNVGSSSNSVVPTAAGPAAAASNSSFGFGTNHHHHQHLYSNSSISSSGGANNSFNSDSKGLKYIDTRTFTRPKKKLDSTFNASNVSVGAAELVPGTHEHTIKMSSPLLNLQIGGPVTLSPTPTVNSSALGSSQLMQKSWLNDVSPPGSIMSSMEFSVNEKLGSSLITSGDFTNVSYLLNGGANGVGAAGEELNSQSSYDGYRLADVIKDRKFLENLSCFDENTMTKDCAISRTDLNGIEETSLSGFSTMQSSLESVTKAGTGGGGDATMVLENGTADATFELERVTEVPAAAAVPAVVRERLNGTFERRRDFNTYRKPKSSLNSTFDALPKVDSGEVIPVANKTFDAGDEDKLLDATFGVAVVPDADCNGTFSLNRTAKVNGAEKQLNQTYEYCEKSPAVADRTFEARKNGTFVEDVGSPANRTPNGTFELPTVDRLGDGGDIAMVQSTPFVQVPRAKRVSGISEYEVNCSPIAAAVRRSDVMRRSRNLEQDMSSSSHMETDDFDVEFRKLPITPNSKTESGSHLLDNEKRISLQHFEEFEKSIMESEHNGLDFDEMLNSLTDVRRSTDSSVKLRQSLDNIKKRHSRINTEKQQEEQLLKRRGTELNDSTPVASPLDNKLADSMIRSMSSSGGSERLLNRRSRYNDDVHLTLSPQQQQQKSTTEQQQEVETNESNRTTTTAESSANPLPTAPEVGGSDKKKDRDRFKTIRISKRREEGMVVVPDPDEDFATAESAALPVEEELPGSPLVTGSPAFGRVDYNSPKESRLADKTEDAVFKRPQLGGIPKGESKIRSLSKPRSYYGVTPSAGGFGLRPKDLSLPLSAKSSSTDNLENDRPNYQQPPPPGRLSLGGKLGGSGGVALAGRAGSTVQSNLKSPMGTKSKSHHNLYFNQGGSLGGSNTSLNRIPGGPLGLSAQKLSHNNSNTELSGVQMRAPKANQAASRLGLVRPSSGYFSYSSSNSHKKVVDSDTESINSLSSSSASSRGSLYRVDSQTIANHVQTGGGPAPPISNYGVEDISIKANLVEPNRTVTSGLKAPSTAASSMKPSGLRPPSNLRPPTARSGLPRPTSYVRR